MKRKFLEELGLDKEVIDSIMDENGKDINKAKGDYEDLKEQLTTATTTISELNKNKGDVAKLQEIITGHETTIANMQSEATKREFNHALEGVLTKSKAKNLKALKSLLDMEKVKLENGVLSGLDEQITALRESDGYLFESDAPNLAGNKPNNNGSTSTGQQKTTTDTFMSVIQSEQVKRR